MEFKAFSKIGKLNKIQMHITQKIHGTNAAVYIFEYTSTDGQHHEPRIGIRAQSRTRFVYPGNDNYGFAAYVEANKEELISKLGPGYHYGEWAGLGINSGEGLLEKKFVLFDWFRYPPERALPNGCVTVPLLYKGPFSLEKIEEVFQDLKTNGSKLSPGFMRPEGIVIDILGNKLKKVFDEEETQWTGADQNKKKQKTDESAKVQEQYGHLFQPIRLEKLLSKDERYVREFPRSMGLIVNDYFQDLVDEQQVTGEEGQIKGIKRMISDELFKFVKSQIEVR